MSCTNLYLWFWLDLRLHHDRHADLVVHVDGRQGAKVESRSHGVVVVVVKDLILLMTLDVLL
jgi:hypothetical protein